MLFESTRGADNGRTFEEVLLKGLADDGGLYIPSEWPQVDIRKLKTCSSFIDIAKLIVPLFTNSSYKDEEVLTLLENTWHDFDKTDLVGIEKIRDDIFIGELFHGPTAAFKDFGLQLCAAFFNKALEKNNKTAIILGATSGDTGSAAIDACKEYENIKTFMLLPEGNMTNIQRKQMTTVKKENVFVLNIEGTFDDCQDIVKAAFKEKYFLKSNQVLLAINSINWTRIIGQICYYFYLGLKINNLSKKLCYSIPSGNFGNVFACYSAMKLGLPVDRIGVSVNDNDILHRFFSNNIYKKESVSSTLSPSMDITVASNFERLVYDFYLERDAEKCKDFFANFPESSIVLEEEIWQKTSNLFCSTSTGDKETIEVMKKMHQDFNYVIDPHTAVGMCASKLFGGPISSPLVILSTAHPGKFLDSLKKANITSFKKHHVLEKVINKSEYSFSLEADQDQIFNFIKRNNN